MPFRSIPFHHVACCSAWDLPTDGETLPRVREDATTRRGGDVETPHPPMDAAMRCDDATMRREADGDDRDDDGTARGEAGSERATTRDDDDGDDDGGDDGDGDGDDERGARGRAR